MIYNESPFMHITRKFFAVVSYFIGWKINGGFPNIPKFVAVIAPHTSLFDFWHMLTARILLKLSCYTKAKENTQRDIYWLAKKSLFKWPLEQFIKKLGAIPVDRSKPHNIVCELARIAINNDTFVIGIAPDGTRRNRIDANRNFKWKTGFYHLAIKANIPVVACCINHSKKTLYISKPIYLTGKFNIDMQSIMSFYKNFT